MSSLVYRSRAHSAAAILNAVVSVMSILLTLPVLPDGSKAVDAANDQPPFGVIVLVFALGIIGLISSYGVWTGQRWGVILTIVVNAVVPADLFGSTGAGNGHANLGGPRQGAVAPAPGLRRAHARRGPGRPGVLPRRRAR